MTVMTQVKKVTALGNGTAFVFSFYPLVIYESTDLTVVRVDADGTETPLDEGTGPTNYSVEVSVYPGTGSITYPADQSVPMVTGQSLVIKRELVLEQAVNLENQGGYNPDTLEFFALDKLLMIDLQQQEEIDRSLRLSLGSGGSVSTELPAPEAGKSLTWNQAEDALENTPVVMPGEVVVNSYWENLIETTGSNVQVRNALELGDAATGDIGVDVQAYNENTLFSDTRVALTVAMQHTLHIDPGGTAATPRTSGTFVLNCDNGMQQKTTVEGSGTVTIQAPSEFTSTIGGYMEVLVAVSGIGFTGTLSLTNFERTIQGDFDPAANAQNLMRITSIAGEESYEWVQLEVAP